MWIRLFVDYLARETGLPLCLKRSEPLAAKDETMRVGGRGEVFLGTGFVDGSRALSDAARGSA